MRRVADSIALRAASVTAKVAAVVMNTVVRRNAKEGTVTVCRVTPHPTDNDSRSAPVLCRAGWAGRDAAEGRVEEKSMASETRKSRKKT